MGEATSPVTVEQLVQYALMRPVYCAVQGCPTGIAIVPGKKMILAIQLEDILPCIAHICSCVQPPDSELSDTVQNPEVETLALAAAAVDAAIRKKRDIIVSGRYDHISRILKADHITAGFRGYQFTL